MLDGQPKFSPGPWLVQKTVSECGMICHHIGLTDYGPVAGVGGNRGERYMLLSGVLDEHDAALIAAAPDLYAALDDVLRAHHHSRGDEYVDAAYTALAKARGEKC